MDKRAASSGQIRGRNEGSVRNCDEHNAELLAAVTA